MDYLGEIRHDLFHRSMSIIILKNIFSKYRFYLGSFLGEGFTLKFRWGCELIRLLSWL